MITENYLDLDVAYFLGLISIRGTLHETAGDKRIIIEFPFKNLIAEGIRIHVDQQEQLQIGANLIRDRLYELVETDIDVAKTQDSVKFTTRFLRNSMVWRNIRYQMGGRNSYTEFQVPASIFASPEVAIKIEYLRGIADAGGFIRDSNRYVNGKRRVYIEVNNPNWVLPVQICSLLQQHLGIPVQTIQWGHPNVRQPGILDPKNTSWAKEHQVKIFAEAFGQIGFYIPYKDKILREFIKSDLSAGGVIPPKCNPNRRIRKINRKPRHPGEKSTLLPSHLRKSHFDAYWQICLAMGCQQCVEVEDPQQSLLDEAEHFDAQSTDQEH